MHVTNNNGTTNATHYKRRRGRQPLRFKKVNICDHGLSVLSRIRIQQNGTIYKNGDNEEMFLPAIYVA